MSTIRFGNFGGHTIELDPFDPVLSSFGMPMFAKDVKEYCYFDYADYKAGRKLTLLPNTFKVTVDVAATSPEEAQKLAEEAVAKIKPKKTKVTKVTK